MIMDRLKEYLLNFPDSVIEKIEGYCEEFDLPLEISPLIVQEYDDEYVLIPSVRSFRYRLKNFNLNYGHLKFGKLKRYKEVKGVVLDKPIKASEYCHMTIYFCTDNQMLHYEHRMYFHDACPVINKNVPDYWRDRPCFQLNISTEIEIMKRISPLLTSLPVVSVAKSDNSKNIEKLVLED